MTTEDLILKIGKYSTIYSVVRKDENGFWRYSDNPVPLAEALQQYNLHAGLYGHINVKLVAEIFVEFNTTTALHSVYEDR